MRIPLNLVRVFFSVMTAASAFGQMPSFAERDPRYHLQPSDVLEVHYRYSPEFDQTVTVRPDGFVSLQLIGDLKLQGLTVDEAKAAILERSVKRLRDPEVTLVLKEFEKPSIFVGGEVTNPGKFELRGLVNPLEAIALAGGFKTLSAKHSQVILLRRVGPDLAKTEILDLKAAMSTKKSEPLADLRAGDMLIVPQNRISKIERLVKLSNLGAYIPF